MPPVFAFESTEMFKYSKKVSRIASVPSMQLFASYTLAKRDFTTYTMYVFATVISLVPGKVMLHNDFQITSRSKLDFIWLIQSTILP